MWPCSTTSGDMWLGVPCRQRGQGTGERAEMRGRGGGRVGKRGALSSAPQHQQDPSTLRPSDTRPLCLTLDLHTVRWQPTGGQTATPSCTYRYPGTDTPPPHTHTLVPSPVPSSWHVCPGAPVAAPAQSPRPGPSGTAGSQGHLTAAGAALPTAVLKRRVDCQQHVASLQVTVPAAMHMNASHTHAMMHGTSATAAQALN